MLIFREEKRHTELTGNIKPDELIYEMIGILVIMHTTYENISGLKSYV
jgi:hypothetical protein